jgi:hypothetical protein
MNAVLFFIIYCLSDSHFTKTSSLYFRIKMDWIHHKNPWRHAGVVDLHDFDADPDPTDHPDADLDYDFYLMRIRIRLFTLMRIRIWIQILASK